MLTIKPSEFLAGSFAVSGTIQRSVLHLTGGGNGTNLTLNLRESDEADFRNQVAILTNQANQINVTRARQKAARHQAQMETDQLANLQNLTRRMAIFTSKTDLNLARSCKSVEQRYNTITKQCDQPLPENNPSMVEARQRWLVVKFPLLSTKWRSVQTKFTFRYNLITRISILSLVNVLKKLPVQAKAAVDLLIPYVGGILRVSSSLIPTQNFNNELRRCVQHSLIWRTSGSQEHEQDMIVQASRDAVR